MIPTEQQEAESLAIQLQLRGYDFTHIPNETGGSPEAKRRAMRMKRAGVSSGFPDYLIFAEGNRIAIELKRKKGGRKRPEQVAWLKTLDRYGFSAAFCNGADEAMQFIDEVIQK